VYETIVDSPVQGRCKVPPTVCGEPQASKLHLDQGGYSKGGDGMADVNVLEALRERARTARDEVRSLIDENVIKATRRYLRQPVFLSTKEERAVVAAYIALCHVTPIGAIRWAPYLGVHNSAGTGKSTLGEVMASLTAGTVSGGHTAASVYRWLDENVGRLFVADEGERILRGARREGFEEILLNGNNIKGTIRRGRPGPKGAGCDTYRVFGPKLIVSIRGAEASTALARRIIIIEMKEPPVAEFSSLRIQRLEQELCNALESWAKTHRDEVRDRYLSYSHSATYGSGWQFANQSQRQLWAGMLAVAEVAGLLEPVATYCRAHEQAAERRIESPLGDALLELFDTLPAGQYRYTDLSERLRQRHGARADRWSEERIGRIIAKRERHPRVGPVEKDMRSRYVVLSGAPVTPSPQPSQPPDMGTLIAATAAAVAAATQSGARKPSARG